MAAAIETLGLGKIFRKRRSLLEMALKPFGRRGEVQALAGIDLAVRHGEIFGLLGPNGAGKTTLLKILSSLVTPTSGAAFVNGHDVVGRQQAVRASIGLVTSDERSFYWRLSGRENLHFFAALANVQGSRIRERCQALLEKVDMVDRADQPFMEYSTGTKQRLAAARALLHNPPIIYMDEPTRSLDPTAAKHLRTFIQETLNRREGKTILLATHNLAEAESLCHRLAILHKSRIRRMGTVSEVCGTGGARERYLIEVAGLDAERAAAPGSGIAFEGCSLSAAPEDGREPGKPGPARPSALVAEVERGGSVLTELLRRLIEAGATVVSCTRHEASLEEVFDLVAGDGVPDGAAPGGSTYMDSAR